MMKNILIPTDFSENAWNALQYAQNFFAKTKCNFYLLHVSDFIDYPLSPVSFEKNETIHAKERTIPSKKQLDDLMRQIEKTFTNTNHKYLSVHQHGFFLESIKKNIEEKRIDLIVMGTRGVTGMRKRIIGSNAGDVITKVKCNTMIVPNGVSFKLPKEIAFPTDYNLFYSHKILEALTELLHSSNGNIHLMNVKKGANTLTSSQEKNKEYLFDYLQETFPEKVSFHSITNKSVNAAIQCFVESRAIDLIFMVAKNLNFLQQILFDTLVEKISFHVSVPFYVIHD